MNLKHNIHVLMAAVAAFSFTASAFAEDKAETAAAPALKADNDKCPVSGKAVDAAHVVAYAKTIGFCCEKCVAKFKADPASIIAKVKAENPVNTKCPVSGKAVDADQTATQNGQTVGFCCEKCLAKFKADPGPIMAKVKADNPVNEKCPVSGKAVDAEQVVLHTVNVGFCCEKCEAKFSKNAEEILSKVAKK
jgi:YHS domain-containing protein